MPDAPEAAENSPANLVLLRDATGKIGVATLLPGDRDRESLFATDLDTDTDDVESADEPAVDWITQYIGPRKVGGRYFNGYWRNYYTVIAIHRTDVTWSITVYDSTDDCFRTHSTPWEPERDRVVWEPSAADLIAMASQGCARSGVVERRGRQHGE